jgi:hypothetical protein
MSSKNLCNSSNFFYVLEVVWYHCERQPTVRHRKILWWEKRKTNLRTHKIFHLDAIISPGPSRDKTRLGLFLDGFRFAVILASVSYFVKFTSGVTYRGSLRCRSHRLGILFYHFEFKVLRDRKKMLKTLRVEIMGWGFKNLRSYPTESKTKLHKLYRLTESVASEGNSLVRHFQARPATDGTVTMSR